MPLASKSCRRSVAIVPHTHWDREWYSPFQTFRLRLVQLLDALLPMLESDLSYARFLLDGQTAVLDDYLEVRPEAARRAARGSRAAGRLAIGPWMVLMDEFMVSGETIVRDLQFGIARGAELGGAMEVGYLPDMFGHVAQMPQLLRLAGFEHAVVWRGVPAAVAQTAFWWEAPDGSRVRAEYLYGSYSNGRDLPDDAKRLVLRARDYEHELGPARLRRHAADERHRPPDAAAVARAGRRRGERGAGRVRVRRHVARPSTSPTSRPTGSRPSPGELRSGARANLLMGVASNRVDVHQACARGRAVARAAGRAAVRAVPPAPSSTRTRSPTIAWRKLVLNSAHDSSCACSADEVVDQVLVRYAEARQIGDGLTRDAVQRARRAGRRARGRDRRREPDRPRARRPRRGARARAPARATSSAPDGDARPAQVHRRDRRRRASPTMVTGQKVRWVLDLMRGTEFAGPPDPRVRGDTGPEHDDQHDIVLHRSRAPATRAST